MVQDWETIDFEIEYLKKNTSHLSINFYLKYFVILDRFQTEQEAFIKLLGGVIPASRFVAIGEGHIVAAPRMKHFLPYISSRANDYIIFVSDTILLLYSIRSMISAKNNPFDIGKRYLC